MRNPAPCRLRDLVSAWQEVRATPARLEKRARLRRLFVGLDAADLRLAASYLAGELPQGSVQVGWSTLVQAERRPEPKSPLPLFEAETAGSPVNEDPANVAGRPGQPARPWESPVLADLDRTFTAIKRLSGSGATKRRQIALQELLEPLAEEERAFLRGLLLGELRQGALRAVVLEAVAAAFEADADLLRRAVMFAGSLGDVLQNLAQDGDAGLRRMGPRPGVPIEPMLAAQAEDLDTALADAGGPLVVEWKLDGVRIQLHKAGRRVHVFSRQLRDVTDLTPEAVALGQTLPVQSIILDGELIAQDAQGRPVPFQDLMSRFSRSKKSPLRRGDIRGNDLFRSQPSAAEAPETQQSITHVEARFFDVLEWNGASQVDRPYAERRSLLQELLPAACLVPGEVVRDVGEARAVYDAALAAGHEGVLLKDLAAPYTAGRRGAAWRKLKPAVTLDLVILAAEWGHGRRQGFLSNLHLGARDALDPERFHMLGKTFKGLTDAMLRTQTQDLLALETRRQGPVVFVRPERVVEIAFDGVQRSRRYASGFALRFARVKRFRPDKSAAQASTLDEVRAIHAARR